jgi:hypothetical protein
VPWIVKIHPSITLPASALGYNWIYKRDEEVVSRVGGEFMPGVGGGQDCNHGVETMGRDDATTRWYDYYPVGAEAIPFPPHIHPAAP